MANQNDENTLTPPDPEVASPATPQSRPSKSDSEGTETGQEMDEFVLGRRGIMAFFTLSVLTLMVALDGTSISVALPVSSDFP